MIILALISNVRGTAFTAMEARHERRFTTNRPPLNLTIVHFGSLEPLKPGDTINPVAIILPNSIARSDPLVIFLGSLEFYYSAAVFEKSEIFLTIPPQRYLYHISLFLD